MAILLTLHSCVSHVSLPVRNAHLLGVIVRNVSPIIGYLVVPVCLTVLPTISHRASPCSASNVWDYVSSVRVISTVHLAYQDIFSSLVRQTWLVNASLNAHQHTILWMVLVLPVLRSVALAITVQHVWHVQVCWYSIMGNALLLVQIKCMPLEVFATPAHFHVKIVQMHTLAHRVLSHTYS